MFSTSGYSENVKFHAARIIKFFEQNKNFSKYLDYNGTELVLMPSSPNKEILAALQISQIKLNAAYICSDDKLLYVNKAKRQVAEIELKGDSKDKFYKTMQPTQEGRVLLESELDEIESITGYTPLDYGKVKEADKKYIFERVKSWLSSNKWNNIPAGAPDYLVVGIGMAIEKLRIESGLDVDNNLEPNNMKASL